MKRRLQVSDHAVLRHLERVLGLDVEAVRREIAEFTAIAVDQPMATGVVRNGYVYKLRDNTVTTVLFNDQLERSLGKSRRQRCRRA